MACCKYVTRLGNAFFYEEHCSKHGISMPYLKEPSDSIKDVFAEESLDLSMYMLSSRPTKLQLIRQLRELGYEFNTAMVKVNKLNQDWFTIQ